MAFFCLCGVFVSVCFFLIKLKNSMNVNSRRRHFFLMEGLGTDHLSPIIPVCNVLSSSDERINFKLWVCDVFLSFSGTRGYISFFSLFPTIRRIITPLFPVKSEAGPTWASSDSLWITAPELENCLINHDVIPSKAVRARAPGAAHCQQLHHVLRCGEAQVGLCSDFKVLPSAVSLFSTELPALSRMQCRALHTRLWLEIT